MRILPFNSPLITSLPTNQHLEQYRNDLNKLTNRSVFILSDYEEMNQLFRDIINTLS